MRPEFILLRAALIVALYRVPAFDRLCIIISLESDLIRCLIETPCLKMLCNIQILIIIKVTSQILKNVQTNYYKLLKKTVPISK
jgi:uncharacterized protein (DUF488 family)